jgi:hypothetical protein
MRYRVTHRSAAARPGLTQVLDLHENVRRNDFSLDTFRVHVRTVETCIRDLLWQH